MRACSKREESDNGHENLDGAHLLLLLLLVCNLYNDGEYDCARKWSWRLASGLLVEVPVHLLLVQTLPV